MISILRSNIVSILPCSRLFLDPFSVALIHFSFALEQGSPTSGPQISTSCQISSGIRLVHLNHPKTTAPCPRWPMEKLSSMKSDPGAKRVGDHCFRGCYNLSPCSPLPERLHDLLLNGIIDKFHRVKLHKHVVLTINNRLITFLWASLVAQLIKNLPTMQETWVRSLGWEDPHGLYSPWDHRESDTTVFLLI